MKILIIDDSKTAASFTKNILERNGYEVFCEFDGQSAIRVLSENVFDLVLLELNLPDVSGIDILYFIREKNVFKDFPVIVVFSEASDIQLNRVLESGATDFIRKPYKDRDLLLRVSNALRLRGTINQFRSSEMYMNQITENMADVAWSIDLEMNTTYISPSVENVIGFSVEEYLKCSVEQRFPLETRMRFYSLLQTELELDQQSEVDLKRTRNIELEHYNAFGDVLILSANVKFIRDEQGCPIGLCGLSRDITALKLAENKLHESEERFKKLSAFTFEGIVIHKNGIIVDVNDAFERILGYSYDELVGKSILSKLIRIEFHQLIASQMENECTEPYEVVGINKKGEVVDIEIEARNISYNGELFRVAAIRDVTERNKVRRAIEETNRDNTFLTALSYELVSTSGDIIKDVALPMLKEHTGVFYAHFSTYDAVSKSLILQHIDADNTIINIVKKVAGAKIFAIKSPVSDENYAYILEHDVKIMHSLEELSFGAISTTVDKAVKAITGFQFFYAVPHVLSGKLYGVTILAYKKGRKEPSTQLLKSFANILALSIDKKMANDELKASEAKQKTIIETIPDILFHMDRKGRFVDFYQPQHLRNLYQPPEMFINSTIHDIFEEDLASVFQTAINEALKKGECQIEYVINDSGPKCFSARLAKLNENEVLSIVSDITTLKQYGVQLEGYAEELENLNATKDRLFSIIGHDLRNPLNNIMGFSQLIQARMDSDVDEKLLKYSDLILDSAQSISDLLSNILTWSKTQQKQVVVAKELFNAHELIDECYELNRASFEQKKIAFRNEIDLNATVYADKSMMSTVFRNLLVNAMKFTNTGGSVFAKSHLHHETFFIEIEDTGIGISEEKIKTLFQINETSTTMGTHGEEGTGFGLLICRDFIDLNGGNIQVKSVVNSGSTFIVEIPINEFK